MGKLLSQLLILLLLYRYYKRMYGEGSGWHSSFALGNVATVLMTGVGTAFFWEYRQKPAGDLLRYLYYSGMFCLFCYGAFSTLVWLALTSRYAEGWWARMMRYFQQVLQLGITQWSYRRQGRDYKFWWRRQEDERLLKGSQRAQTGNACLLAGGLSLLLLVGALGFFDVTSYEGWWHCVYWRGGSGVNVLHWFFASVVFLILVRAYYFNFLLLGTIRDLDTGIIYRTWLRLTSVRRIVRHDTLYPSRIKSWEEWEARGPWYEDEQIKYYELPSNWYSFHYYAMDWDYTLSEERFYRYYSFNKHAIRQLAQLYSKYKRLLEYESENCLTHIYEEEDYG